MANPLSPQQALARLRNLCSRGEKCTADLRTKLTAWQINADEAAKIIKTLIEDKYVDDERYAVAFVRDKSRFSHWGILKIKMALKTKNIPTEIISKALSEIDSDMYEEELDTMLCKKMKSIKAKNTMDLKAKLIRFGLSRGFEYELVYRRISKLMKNIDIDEE